MFLCEIAEVLQSPHAMRTETVLILASGEWAGTSSLRSLVRSADFVIAADGGYAKARAHGIRVDEVVGDLDSIPESERGALASAGTPAVYPFPRDKDWTDLELAVDHALRKNPARIVLFGVLGNRLDHALTAFHLLEKGVTADVPIVLLAGDESVRLVHDDATIVEAAIGDRVSLVPLSDAVVVTTSGLRFPLRGERLERSASRGVSNEVEELPVRIHVESGLVLVIHAPSEAIDD